MATRGTVTHSGGASAPLQPNGTYVGIVTAVTAPMSAKVRISSLGITVGPCRAVDGVVLEKGKQVLCIFLNGRLSEMAIIGNISGVAGDSGVATDGLTLLIASQLYR